MTQMLLGHERRVGINLKYLEQLDVHRIHAAYPCCVFSGKVRHEGNAGL